MPWLALTPTLGNRSRRGSSSSAAVPDVALPPPSLESCIHAVVSRRGREKSGTRYLVVGSVSLSPGRSECSWGCIHSVPNVPRPSTLKYLTTIGKFISPTHEPGLRPPASPSRARARRWPVGPDEGRDRPIPVTYSRPCRVERSLPCAASGQRNFALLPETG